METLDFNELREIISSDESLNLILQTLHELYRFDSAGQWHKEFYVNTETKKLECSGVLTRNTSLLYNHKEVYCGTIQSWNVDDDYSFFEIKNYDAEDLKRLEKEGCIENGRIISVPEWAVDNSDVKYEYACNIRDRFLSHLDEKEYSEQQPF